MDGHFRVRPWGLVRLAIGVVVAAVIAVVVVRNLGGENQPQASVPPPEPDHPATTTSHPSASPSKASRSHRPPPKPHQVKVPHLPYPLAKHSCIIYPPTKGHRHRTVFLDPGHGGHDPGTVGETSSGKTIHEKRLTLPVAKKTADRLRAHGYRVVLSRTADDDILQLPPKAFHGDLLTPKADHKEIAARIACANAAKADVLVSIHFNSFGDPSVGGAQTHYDGSRPFGKKNKQLATLLQNHIITAFHKAGWPVPDRGLRSEESDSGNALTEEGESYGHLFLLGPRKKGWNNHPSQMPGALVEPLFLSRPTEADVLVSDHGQRVLAKGIAKAITQFLQK